MAFENEKAMGPIRPPMAFHPAMGLDLWVTLAKIKIKEVKVRKEIHSPSFGKNNKQIGLELSSEILKISEKAQKSLI